MTLRVIVAQMGARHGYAVPRMLHQHGALSRLYTDFCVKGVAGRAAWPLLRRIRSPLAGKLRRRTARGVPASKIFTSPLVNIRSALTHDPSSIERYLFEDEVFGRQMIRWDTSDANVIYAMLDSGTPFWRYARSRGLKIAVDLFITPLCHRIVAQEHVSFPDWVSSGHGIEIDIEDTERVFHAAIEAADLLLCPSLKVQRDLGTFAAQAAPPNATPPNSVIVPYGAPAYATSRQASGSTPIAGRVLFSGTAEPRKGIHYLAMAAHSLRGAGHRFEFRIAGLASERARNHPMARGLTFLGHLSREDMREEYAKADLFVLPTLAEGSASVVYEALAAGLPVVTTPSAGSVLTHGREGLLVPERDSDALAAAIETIVRDRSLRDAMANAALATSLDFGEQCWGTRIVAALSTLLPTCAADAAPFSIDVDPPLAPRVDAPISP